MMNTKEQILRKMEALEADNQKLAPTDSGKVRMDRLRKLEELRGEIIRLAESATA